MAISIAIRSVSTFLVMPLTSLRTAVAVGVLTILLTQSRFAKNVNSRYVHSLTIFTFWLLSHRLQTIVASFLALTFPHVLHQDSMIRLSRHVYRFALLVDELQ